MQAELLVFGFGLKLEGRLADTLGSSGQAFDWSVAHALLLCAKDGNVWTYYRPDVVIRQIIRI
jgi:hypothetical protein